MNLAVALIVTALAVTAFASVSTDNSSAENSVGIPTAVSDLVYDGNLKTGVPEGTGYTVTGNTATDAESYNATLTRESGYVWSDGTEDAKEITWSIAKGEIRLNITDYSSISYGRRISDNLEVEFNDGNRTEFNGKFTVEHSAGSGEYSTEVPKNAGGYYLKVTVTDPNIESPVLNYNFTISRIKLCDCDDYNFDMDPSGNITYDGNEHPVGICISTDRVYEQIDDSVTVSNSKDGSSYSDAKPVDVGTYSIKITAKPDTNYEEEKILENVLTIISKTVTVTINDVINAMNNNNTFDDSSLNSSLNNDYCRVVVKEDANYVITRDSNSNVILENKTTAAKVNTADVVVSLCSKVTFDINSRDAEGSMDDTIALNSYNLPECGYKAKGKHFVGWSLTPDGETIATKSVPVTERTLRSTQFGKLPKVRFHPKVLHTDSPQTTQQQAIS